MPESLVTYDELVRGTLLDRPNRFTVRVEFDGTDVDLNGTDLETDGAAEPVYLRNSGGMETALSEGRDVLCRPASNPDRKTDYDAIASRVGDVWVTVDAALPNRIFEACIADGRLPRFEGYRIEASEPPLPDEGRTDFELRRPTGEEAYVEVKSNTYVVDGVSKFPDRPTERGRRHLRSLTALAEEGIESHVVFVVQRPDADRLRPFREVDPEFAYRLGEAANAGVGVSAITTTFHPPEVRLAEPDLPVEID